MTAGDSHHDGPISNCASCGELRTSDKGTCWYCHDPVEDEARDPTEELGPDDTRALARVHRWLGNEGISSLQRLLKASDPKTWAKLKLDVTAQITTDDRAASTIGSKTTVFGVTSLLVRRLISCEFPYFYVIEVSPVGLAVLKISLDQTGSPRIEFDRRDLRYWAEAPDEDSLEMRVFSLAGGTRQRAISEIDPEYVTEILSAEIDTDDRANLHEVVVVAREPAWASLGQVAQLLEEKLLPTAIVVDHSTTPYVSPSRVTEAVRLAPLRDSRYLGLVELESDGRVSPSAIEVFSAGSMPERGNTTGKALEVRTPTAGANGPFYLPILLTEDQGDISGWQLEKLYRLEADLSSTLRLSLSLKAGQGVSIDEITYSSRAAERPRLRFEQIALSEWNNVRQRIPSYSTPSRDVDLVVLIELDGKGAEVRRNILDRLLGYLTALSGSSERLRVAVVGYHDHPRRRGPGRDLPLLEAESFCAARQLKSDSLLLTGRPAEDGRNTAVEDALAYLAGAPSANSSAVIPELPTLKWRTDAYRALIVIGARPPAPDKQGQATSGSPCDLHLDWRTMFDSVGFEGRGFLAAAYQGSRLPSRGTLGSDYQRVLSFWNTISGGQLVDIDTAHDAAQALAAVFEPAIARSDLFVPLCLHP